MTYDDIDIELAAEEHRAGRSFGERGHCSRCDDVWRVANCPHTEMATMRNLSGDIVTEFCTGCGTPAREVSEYEKGR